MGKPSAVRKGRHLSLLIKQQLLNATVVICALLYLEMTLNTNEIFITALRCSRTVWVQNDDIFREAKKAAHTMAVCRLLTACLTHRPSGRLIAATVQSGYESRYSDLARS